MADPTPAPSLHPAVPQKVAASAVAAAVVGAAWSVATGSFGVHASPEEIAATITAASLVAGYLKPS